MRKGISIVRTHFRTSRSGRTSMVRGHIRFPRRHW